MRQGKKKINIAEETDFVAFKLSGEKRKYKRNGVVVDGETGLFFGGGVGRKERLRFSETALSPP